MRRERVTRYWRISRRQKHRAYVWIPATIVIIASTVIPLVVGSSWSTVLSLCGISISIAALVAQEITFKSDKSKSVVFISSSQSSFTKHIFEGVQDGLREYSNILVRQIVATPGRTRLTVSEQIAHLRDAKMANTDAIVIRPSELTEELTTELVRLTKAGIFVVFVNTPPKIERWMEPGLPLPTFVGSDMKTGGALVGKLIVQTATEVQATGLIILQGPSSKVSNLTRAAWCAREILASNSRCPCVIHELDEFDEQSVIVGIKSSLAELDDRAGGLVRSIVVHTGTDRAGIWISKWISQTRPRGRRFALIGYDGLTNADGSLVAADTSHMVATIDQCPYLIGKESAAHIVAAYERREALRPREVHVTPTIIRLSS